MSSSSSTSHLKLVKQIWNEELINNEDHKNHAGKNLSPELDFVYFQCTCICHALCLYQIRTYSKKRES